MNKIIAIVGMSGSGKSFACETLEKLGYQNVYFGGVIYDKMKKEKIEITPASQKEFRENLRKKYGMGVIATLLLDKIETLFKKGNVVLDGLYSWDEYKILKEKFPNLIMICIVADKNIRYDRVSKRKDRPYNKEEIIKRDIAEIENSAKGGPIAYADYYILNNEDKESYKKHLLEIIKIQERGNE